MRVVLYCEGFAESGGIRRRPAPGVRLEEVALGPAHIILRRSIAGILRELSKGLYFVEGLRLRGVIPRGSHLHVKKNLRRLFVWADPEMRPDIQVALVDRDGRKERRKLLKGFVEDLRMEGGIIIAVAREEFESWLLADHSAVCGFLGAGDDPGDPEKWRPGAAKKCFETRVRSSETAQRDVRLGIARKCDLSALNRRCESFRHFQADLRNALLSCNG